MNKELTASVITIILIFFLVSSGLSLAENSAPIKGGLLPLFKLPVPKDLSERSYLGLAGKGFFKIPQIKAGVVIIEIFSMY